MSDISPTLRALYDAQDAMVARLDALPSELEPGENARDAAIGDALAAIAVPLQKHLAETIDRVADLVVRLDRAEGRIAELEAAGLKYAGIYTGAVSYRRGTVVTYHGSAWIAVRDIESGASEPDKSNPAWHLMVQRGRDASGRDRGSIA